MLTLSYGYKKPETNDKGPAVFPALEADIQQLNDHNHDGANSALLTAQSIVGSPQTLLAANWVALGGGNFKQTVAMLPGFIFDTTTMSFRDPDGTYIMPSVKKVSPTSFDVFTNDSTINMYILYGV